MKTNNIFRTVVLTLAFISITGLSLYAKKPVIESAVNIQSMIKKTITYPDIAVNKGYTGSVDVLFTLTEDGKINVKKTTAENAEIEKLVKEQLAAMSLKDIKTTFNQHYWIRITFKLTE
jgi:outer membrane biosynthesis protein TonB